MSSIYRISNILLSRINLIETSFSKTFQTVKMPYYAVAKGRNVGIFNSWAECEAQVKGFSGAKFKKFDTVNGANEFIDSIGTSSTGGNYKTPARSNLKRSYSSSQCLESNYRNVSSLKSNRQAIEIEPPRAPQPKRSKYNNVDFEEDNDGYVQVYTDGACSSNGKVGARAGLGVFWGDYHPLNKSEPVSGRATNNCGEIQAATAAIKTALENGVKKLTINTDSQFLIKSATQWMPGWKQRGWKLSSGEQVKNEADFKELDKVQNKLQIKWNYVRAHDGTHGNEMADKFAKVGASLYKH